jgi:hypothetical protein
VYTYCFWYVPLLSSSLRFLPCRAIPRQNRRNVFFFHTGHNFPFVLPGNLYPMLKVFFLFFGRSCASFLVAPGKPVNQVGEGHGRSSGFCTTPVDELRNHKANALLSSCGNRISKNVCNCGYLPQTSAPPHVLYRTSLTVM